MFSMSMKNSIYLQHAEKQLAAFEVDIYIPFQLPNSRMLRAEAGCGGDVAGGADVVGCPVLPDK